MSDHATRTRLIDEIQQINRSAHRDWLESFGDDALRHYLDRLHSTLEPRGARRAQSELRHAEA